METITKLSQNEVESFKRQLAEQTEKNVSVCECSLVDCFRNSEELSDFGENRLSLCRS